MVAQLLSDTLVILLQEVDALLLRGLFVFHGEHLELLTHLVFELPDEFISDLSNGYFVEDFKCQLF